MVLGDFAPEAGIEPATNRLTADRSTAELLRKSEKSLYRSRGPGSTLIPKYLCARRGSNPQPSAPEADTLSS